MRVKTLIEQLQKCNPESEVIVLTCDDNPINGDGIGINQIFQITFADKSETTIVYIDSTAN